MVKNRRANKSVILAAAIVALTATYLLVTGAMAQAEKGVAKDSGVEYTRDRLSYGDIWAFDYAKTKYAESEIDSKATEWGKYTSPGDDLEYQIDNDVIKDTIAYDNLYRFYLDPTTCEPTYNQYHSPYEGDCAVYQWKTDRSVIAGSPVHTGKGESLFFSGNTSANVTGTEDISINTVKSEAGNARYTVVPNNGGDYTVYVYSKTQNPVLRCAVLDTGAKYNEFANGGGRMREKIDDISLEQIGNTSWYKGTIHVDNTHWSAYTVTCATSWDVTIKNIKGKESLNSSTSLVLAEKAPTRSLSSRGNQWESTEVWFDTLLVFEFDSNTQLGPITQKGQLTIRSGNDGGTMTAKNVFGETVEVGKSTATEHADIVITPAPKSGFKFAGFKDGAAKAMSGSNNYVYSFRADNTITGLWLQEGLTLPTMTVTRTKDGIADESFGAKPLNFISDNKLTGSTKCTESFTYTIAIDWTDVTTEGVTYTYQVNGGETKTITSVDTTITLENVRWDTQKVTFTATPEKGVAQEAVFTAQADNHVGNTATAPADCVASIGRNHYYYLEDALLEAKNGDKVILAKDAGFAEEVGRSAWTEENAGYTVKSGVTLVVPFDKDGTAITDPDDTNLYSEKQHSAVKEGFKAYRTLTLASGKTLSVHGTLVVGGRWASASGGHNASIVPPYGLIQMEENSHISVENGGKLYAWGYISRATSDDRTQDVGDVTVKNGGTVYEIFQIQDFRGGGQSVAIALGSERVFPFSQYYVQNIEVPLTLQAGAKETAATALYAGNQVNAASFTMIGGETEGLFRLTSAGASLKRTYDPSKDRMTYAMNGSTEINSIQMSLAGNPVDSSNYYLPINSGISVKVESGTTTIAGDIALLPGVEVTVDDNATLAVAEEKTLFVYDADEWVNKGYVGNGGNKDMAAAPYSVANGTTAVRKNESLVDAAVTVNGTLKADGNVCTSASGANITCGENGQLNIGVNGIQTSAILQAKAGEKIGTPHTAAQLKNADGSYSQTAGVKNATLTKGDEGTFIKTSTDGKQEQETVKLQVGTDPAKCYFTYAAAISSLGQSKSATLTALSESTETVAIDVGKTITIDVNGKKIGTIQNLSNMTIIGKGSIQSIQNTGAGSVTIPKESAVQVAGAINDGVTFSIAAGSFIGGIENKDGSKLVISDGTFAAELINQMGGTATISGGTFKGLNNRGTITLSRGKFDEVKNQGTITVTSPADVKIKSLPITGTLVDSKGTPLTLKKTADAEGYYSLTENTATIRFNCNGTKDGKTIATGETDEKKVRLVGSTVYAYPFTMTAENYSFKGWAKSADATETLFAADETKNATLDAQTLKENGATVGGTLNLYAVYQKEWSYKIIWNVDGKQVQETHWTDSMKEASYTLAADVTNAITEVKVTGPEESYTMTRRNRSVTLSGVKADLIVNITTGIEEGKPTYYMGEMSFQYYKNMAVFTNDGWKMLDNYTWRHKTGSVTHEVGENTYTVANGDILLVNDSNQVYAYTIKLDEKGTDFNWAHMEFLLDGKAVVGRDEIKVEVQPGKKATVTAKMVGDTEKLDMKDQPLGKIKVEMQPAE